MSAARWRLVGWVLAALIALGLSTARAGPADPGTTFQAPALQGAKPWTHERFDDAPADFAFAVVTDLESGYRDGVFDVAAAELALLRPAFVIAVGDLIEGGSEDEAKLRAEWDQFDGRLAGIHAPFFHVGGNHDLTNGVQRRVWASRYGPRYYHFSYKGVLFLVLDTEDYTPARQEEIYRMRADYLAARKTDPARAETLPYPRLMEAEVGEIGPEQAAYFEKALRDNPHPRWTVLLMHKPAWRREDGRGLGPIEAALKGRPYTVLSGHLHRYGYSTRNGRDYITLGTTGGERAFDGSPGAVDHVMWVTMTDDGPSIANLRLDGVFDKTGHIPADGEALCLDHGGPKCPR
jgi:hypothetical protein